MIAWLKGLFGSMDRQTTAADRAARAMEDIADDLESVRDQFRARLGIAPPLPVVALPAPAPVPKPEEDPAKGKPAKGREK